MFTCNFKGWGQHKINVCFHKISHFQLIGEEGGRLKAIEYFDPKFDGRYEFGH